jgi:hypothetical protein
VSERLIEQPWKGCVGLVPTAGSNPALSVLGHTPNDTGLSKTSQEKCVLASPIPGATPQIQKTIEKKGDIVRIIQVGQVLSKTKAK